MTSALTTYIAMVGIGYSLLLRQSWNPEGLQKTADILLHDAMPMMFVGCWLFAFTKARLPWNSVLFWLLYPVAYLCFALIRVHGRTAIPPFIDAGKLGSSSVLSNEAQLLAAFIVFCLLVLVISRWPERN